MNGLLTLRGSIPIGSHYKAKEWLRPFESLKSSPALSKELCPQVEFKKEM
jgi:hypothetical protein